MAFIPSPMKNFNKNNQYVIIAKSQYAKSVDNIQDLSKSNIKMMIRNGAALLLVLLLQIIRCVLGKSYCYFGWAFFSFLLIAHLILGYALIQMIRWYTIDHPAVKAFDNMLRMEMAEIVSTNMSHEDILKCLHLQYRVEGELMEDMKWLKITYLVLLILVIIDALWSLVTIFL